MVSKCGVYSYNIDSADANTKLLENAGFVEHKNCFPYLAESKASKTSKTDAELRKIDNFYINVASRNTKKGLDQFREDMLQEEAARIDGIRKPLLIELSCTKEKMKHIANYTKQFRTHASVHLRELEQHRIYSVMAAKKQATRFGDTYKLLVEMDDGISMIWSNTYINILVTT